MKTLVTSVLALSLLSAATFGQSATEDAQISASSCAGARFGTDIDIDGDRMAVIDSNNAVASISLFERGVDGEWVEETVLLPEFATSGRWGDFARVELAGDLLVAAPFAQEFGTGRRAALFERQPDDTWLQLEVPFGSFFQFPQGEFPAIGDGWIALGFSSSSFSSRIRIIEKGPSGAFETTAEFFPPSRIYSMAAQGDELLIGMNTAQAVQSRRRGPNSEWNVAQDLQKPFEPGATYGFDLDIDGDRFVTSSLSVGAAPAGIVGWVHERSPGGDWQPASPLSLGTLAPNGSTDHISLLGERVVVGESGGLLSFGAPGRAFLFERRAEDDWVRRLTLAVEDKSTAGQFGWSVELDEEQLLVGHPGFGIQDSGAIEVFELASLYRGGSTASLSAGGSQDLFVRPPFDAAGDAYAILGSVAGTSPGFPIPGSSLTLPLVQDAYFNLTLATLGTLSSPVRSSLGIVQPQAEAEAQFVLPMTAPASVVGMTAYHAYLTLDGTGAVTHVSNPVGVALIP